MLYEIGRILAFMFWAVNMWKGKNIEEENGNHDDDDAGAYTYDGRTKVCIT